MITEFGGFKLGDRVQYVKGGPCGTVVWFDQAWLKANPDAELFDAGIIWDDFPEGFDPLKQHVWIDIQCSNKIRVREEWKKDQG